MAPPNESAPLAEDDVKLTPAELRSITTMAEHDMTSFETVAWPRTRRAIEALLRSRSK